MSKPREKTTVEVDISSIRYHLGEMVKDEVEALVAKHLSKSVEAEVQKIAREHVQAGIAAAAAKAMADGWEQTDEYGRGSGKTVKVKDLLLTFLNARDRYSSEGSWLERTMRNLLQETMQKTIAPEIEAAKKMFREMLDSSIRDKLALALREAMGLR